MIGPAGLVERPVQLQGSRLAQAVLKALGWTLVWEGLPARQGVLVAYPHTSNWDFVVGMLAKWAIGIPANFWGKDSLFRIPLLGRWMRWIGGIPVDRANANGIVGSMVQRFAEARERGDFLWLALAPEGTRSLRSEWRSGFYQLALRTGAPVGLVIFDYGRKRVGVNQFLQLCGRPEADVAAIAAGYAGVVGKRPALASPIRIRST